MSATKDPEAFAERFFRRRGLSLPVPIDAIDHEGQECLRTWHVRPQSWLSYLMGSSPELLAGEGDACTNFRCFWQMYRCGHPHHKVFDSPLENCLEQVVPLLIHGDEGRSQKKGKCMVLSMQSILGSLPDRCTSCTCHQDLMKTPGLPSFGAAGDSLQDYCLPEDIYDCVMKQATNYRGSTFVTRWLLFSLGSWVYHKYPEVMDVLHVRMASDFKSLFEEGFLVGTRRFYGAVIAVKGDMEWHKSLFNLQRSYARSGTVYTGPVCHMCLAGGGGPMFEDYSESPQWRLTCFASRPWGDNEPVPPLATIPAYPAPEELLHLDPFHLCKMGIGRNITGGILVYLARRQFFDFEGCEAQGFSFPARLERAHRSFLLWTKAEGHHPSLRSFNKAFLNMKSLASAPWCNTKGADTTLMMQWLLWYLTLVLRDPPEFADTGMLQKMRKLAQAYLNMFSSIHGHGLWMTRPCARKLYIEMMRVLRGYQLLGSLCLQAGYRAFIQKPKNHGLHHVALSLKEQLCCGCPLVLNPEAWSCEQDEDFVGRISRLSRKVDVRKQGYRVFNRLFLKIRAVRRRRKGCKG